MKGYEEIRRILTEDFGFVDLAAYKRWIADVRPNIALTVDLLQKLTGQRRLPCLLEGLR